MHWFEDLTDARAKMQTWQKDYNEERPHGLSRTERPCSTRRSGTNRGQKIADPVDLKLGGRSVHSVLASGSNEIIGHSLPKLDRGGAVRIRVYRNRL